MRVYSVLGVPPEIQAYGLAKYSRSAQSLDQSVDELSSQRAEQFLNTFYFEYGHRSIADLAHITIALEDISMLAAFYVVDEPLWDGQGRSSRYQNFRKSGFYIPKQLDDTDAGQHYRAALEYLLGRYEYFSSQISDVLRAVVLCPSNMDEAKYSRTLRARAFDIARYFLPLATLTSNGQVTSARVLEQQISRLAAHSLPELQEVAAGIRTACETPGHNFVHRKLEESWTAAQLSVEQMELQRQALQEGGILNVSAAPTLVKYTAPAYYEQITKREVDTLLALFLAMKSEVEATPQSVSLVEPELDFLGATLRELLYLSDPQGRSYSQLGTVIQAIPSAVKEQAFHTTFSHRGSHDDLLRLHRVGYEIGFDLLVDFGSLRDLHRHRRCVQIIPDLKLHLGFDDPQWIFEAGLGAEGAELAEERGLIKAFAEAMEIAIAAARDFPDSKYSAYLLPLGVRQRALFKMDLAEAIYIIEQRSQVGGHFSYRRVAFEMYQRLCQHYPYLEPVIRVTNPHEVVQMLAR